MRISRLSALLTASATALLVAQAPAAMADDVADFYRGKQISLVHTGGTGGTFAVYTRVLAKYLGKHIPGNPNVVVQFKSGGGGIVGMNYLYNAAPKDGTYILMPIAGVEVQPFVEPKKVKFDPTKVHWLGNMTQLQSYVAVWHTVPVRTWQDARTREVTFGATGTGSETYLTPMMMNALLGTKFKVITGYKGIAKVNLALERGEVEGRGGGWTPTMRPEWFKTPHKIRLLAQVGDTKLDEAWKGVNIADVPLLKNLPDDEEDRQLLSLLSRVLARPLCVAPEVPKARVDALRKAFDDTMKDPETIAEIKKRKLQIINPMTWQEVTAHVQRIADLPERVKQRYREALGRK